MNPFADSSNGQPPAVLRAFRVLLCDAQSAARSAMKNCLAGIFPHLSIEEAQDGVHAVRAARAEVFNLILLDVDLPQIGGYQALHEIRTQSMNQNSLIVMLTAHADIEDVVRAGESAADSHLYKPFHQEAVEDSLMEVLAYSV